MESYGFTDVYVTHIVLPDDVIGTVTYSCAETATAIPVSIIYNDPYTIVIFSDGDKVIVKAEGDEFSREHGLAQACLRKMVPNRNYVKKLIERAKVQLPKEQ